MSNVQQTVYGDVGGYVAGRDINLFRPTHWDLERDELLQLKAETKRDIGAAWRRLLLSWPAVIWAVLMLAHVGMLYLHIDALVHTPRTGMHGASQPPVLLLCVGMALVICTWFVNRIGRIERAVVRSAQQDLEQIEVVLRRRGW